MNKTPTGRPDILEFKHLREYIDAMVCWRKLTEKEFSIKKYFIGASCSSSLYYMYMSGKCGFALEHTDVFSKLMGLDDKEKKYFEKWAKLSRSQRGVSPQHCTLTPKQLPKVNPRPHILNDWLNSYVAESVNHKDFKEDPEVIAKILGGIAPPERIKKSLNFLIKEGFLRRIDKGRLILDEEVITTTRHISNLKIQRYHRKVLDLARTAIKDQPIEDRNTSAFVFVATKERAKKYYDLVEEFMDQVQELYHEEPDGDEEIYHMALHFSPVVGRKNV